MPILDCHVHLNNYNKINKAEKKILSLEERLNALLESMQNNNIDYSIILSSYKVDNDRPSTYQIIDSVKRYSSRLGVVAGFSIDNHTCENLEDYRKWLKDGLIKGIKLYCGYEHHYPYDERYQRVYDMCIEYGAPVMIHTGDTLSHAAKIKYSHPLNIDDVAVDNPELKIVMCHLGNPWILDCQEVLYKNKNVYADISGLSYGDYGTKSEEYVSKRITELLNYIGEPRCLLYGTDWPISDMGFYREFFKRVELKPLDRDL